MNYIDLYYCLGRDYIPYIESPSNTIKYNLVGLVKAWRDNTIIASLIGVVLRHLPGTVILLGFLAAALFYFFPCNIVAFSGDPDMIKLGDSLMLSWKVEGANSVEIDQGVGSVPNEGSIEIFPAETTVYTISAKNIFGCKKKETKVTVMPKPDIDPSINYFYADPESIKEGENTKLNWDVSDVQRVFIDHEIGEVSATGQKNVQPRTTTTYTLTASNVGGSIDKQVRVEVLSLPKPMINYFYADSESIKEGEDTKLNWDVSDAQGVSIDHGIGGVNSTGQKNVQPRTTTTYTLTASNDGGSIDKQVRVEVNTESKPSASDLVKLGDANRLMGKDKDAENAYLEAIRLDPNNAQAWAGLSFVQNRQGHPEDALVSAENAIDFDPTYESAWNTKGNALAKLERFDEAIQAYNKVIELNSTNSNAWYNKGRILCMKTEYDEAIEAFDGAIDIDPLFAESWYYKGIALDQVGLTTEANSSYAKAKELGYID